LSNGNADSESDVFEDSKEDINELETETDSLFTTLKWKYKSEANIKKRTEKS
jgi:hypothetical protein